jgi:hypothetical protein
MDLITAGSAAKLTSQTATNAVAKTTVLMTFMMCSLLSSPESVPVLLCSLASIARQ